MEFADILYNKESGIATITLNHPETMNAVTASILGEWLQVIEDARDDDDVKVLIVTGSGRGFCSGKNPRSLDAVRQEKIPKVKEGDGMRRIAIALSSFDKPYIGAINGPATGGGMDLASMCDIRIASEKAKFGMAYVRMGVTPGGAGCYFLPRIIGISRACELIWTGRIIDAQEAFQIGYVLKVVPHDDLIPAAKEFASQLAKGPIIAIRNAKRLIYGSLDTDLKSALYMHQWSAQVVGATEDAKEGPRAWVEKREPIFKGK